MMFKVKPAWSNRCTSQGNNFVKITTRCPKKKWDLRLEIVAVNPTFFFGTPCSNLIRNCVKIVCIVTSIRVPGVIWKVLIKKIFSPLIQFHLLLDEISLSSVKFTHFLIQFLGSNQLDLFQNDRDHHITINFGIKLLVH